MFKTIFRYELAYWAKQRNPYIYFATLGLLAFFLFVGTAGLFDSISEETTMARFLNSPHEINYLFQYFNKIFLFLLPTIIGTAIYRDVQEQRHSILYTYPLEKGAYLAAKFLSSFLVVVLITSSIGLAFFIGEHCPGLHPNKLGDFSLLSYVQVYACFTIPSLFFLGLLIFAVVALSRNIYAGFITCLLVLIVQVITNSILGETGYYNLFAILDPLGQNAANYLTATWTLEEENTQMIPVSGLVLYNRLFWLSLSLLLGIVLYHVFTFSQFPIIASFKQKKQEEQLAISNKKTTRSVPHFDFTIQQHLRVVFLQSQLEFRSIRQSWTFFLFIFLGIGAIIFTLAKITNLADMTLLPVTRIMLSVPAFFFSMISTLSTFLYAGLLVHRNQQSKIHQLVDSSPVPNWVLLSASLLTLLKIQVILLAIFIFSGISIQLYNGYQHLEIGLYLFHAYIVVFPALIIWAMFALGLHTLIRNSYLGLFFLIVFFLGLGSLPNVGLDSRLLLFNSLPSFGYSDMDAYANHLPAYFLVKIYWFAFVLLLIVIAQLFWNRGYLNTAKDRFRRACTAFRPKTKYLVTSLCFVFLTLGWTIHAKERQDQLPFGENQAARFAAFEKNYQVYQGIIQPKITAIDVQVDLFPESNAFEAKGHYILKNKSDKVIDTLLIKRGFDEITSYTINRSFTVIKEDAYVQFSVLKLEEGLQPNDSLQLNFDIHNRANTFFERNSNVLNNGTFLLQDAFPSLGYFLNKTPQDPSKLLTRNNHHLTMDSDLVSFNTIVSTSKDQIALAPGALQKEWTEGERRYFHYRMDRDILYSIGFNSGRFQVKKETYKGVDFEIYYHKDHPHNLTKMMNGLKGALDYNRHYFGPYQHQQARIIEFSDSEGTFATSCANNLPMSEIRFITNTENNKVDLPFYVPAHELTHQWWGSQVIPADALGALMLVEGITEYISLNIYRRAYGNDRAMNFLHLQRKRYLKGHYRNTETEPPLMFVAPNQSYIAYGKGTLSFHALSHYLGEDTLNQILKSFLITHKFKTNPYPTSVDFITHLKASCPDSLQKTILDLFERVVLYEHQFTKATSQVLNAHQSDITLEFNCKKFDATKKQLPLNEFIEIGLYNQAGDLLHLQRIRVQQASTSYQFVIDHTDVAYAVIDPNLLTIDKNIDDNRIYF